MATDAARNRSILVWIFSLILAVVGLVLIVGGARLLTLGGSPYYLLAGLLVVASAVLTWRRDPLGPWIFGLMLVLSVGWSIWEAGYDGWALAARLIAPFVLGLGFLLPGVSPRRAPTQVPVRASGWPAFGGGLVVAILIGSAVMAIGPHDPANPIYQAGKQAAVPEPGAVAGAPAGGADWLNYGADQGGSRFSALTQLNADNVGKLQVAWTADLGNGPNGKPMQLEVTPLKVGRSVYVCTAASDVISLDAETGRVNWRFQSGNKMKDAEHAACRGVAYFRVPSATGPCAERIITNTTDARLIALDTATGVRCAGFGDNGSGETSLIAGMGKVSAGYYYVSSAPTIVRGKVVLGGWVADGQYWGEPSGVIRAFDATTGKFAWAFDMGRPGQKGEPGPNETYTHSTPNSWAPMSADETLGLVFAPTGNATPDYYGAQRRPFDDKYSSSVIAIDVETGDVRWSFQTTHHDLWDYDVASQPSLVDLATAGGVQHALLAPTKRGELFMLDRTSGQPIAVVNEHLTPQGHIAPGERLSATQPFSDGMPSFRGAELTERDMWGLTPLDQLWCRIKFREARYDGPLTPISPERPIISYPGYLGGMDWGGISIDRSRGIAVVNSSKVGNYNILIPRAEADKKGLAPLGQSGGAVVDLAGASPQAGTPYAGGVTAFLSPLGAPCNEPPYGVVSAVDLKTHKLLWTRPVGTARDSGPFGIPTMLPIPMGVPMSGGTITTAGGLIFMGATQERAFRALDIRTGKELFYSRLPAGGQATPMTYLSPDSNRQFVVIAAGGNAALQSKEGSTIVAYALPKS